MAPIRVCTLSPSYEGSNSVFTGLDPTCDPSVWMKEDKRYEFTHVAILKPTAVQQVRDLIQSGKYDCFINLCDGSFDEDRPGMEVVKALEFYGAAFTGADSGFYEPTKEIMKMVAIYEGVKTPSFQMAFNADDIEDACRLLKFPTIVKHFNGYSSVGMTKKSRCETPDELRSEAQRFIDTFGGALIEEFIEGREATVLVAENSKDPSNPFVFTPVECHFPEGETFKHFELKWCDYKGIQWAAVQEPDLSERLMEASKRIFVALGGVSYGRCDMRINKDGEVYFLEINPNCGIFYPPTDPGSADYILDIDPIGHHGFITMIIDAAIAKYKRKHEQVDKAAVRYSPKEGYMLRATRDIKAGEVIFKYEETDHPIVTKEYVDRHWDEQKKKWFAQYCYPISDEVYVMWSSNPTGWRPINHSCDPNCWYDDCGMMDLVARRDIKKGQQLTIDYCTFCTDHMETFNCMCGAAKCRKVVTGQDYKNKAIIGQYGTHMSPYVLSHNRKF